MEGTPGASRSPQVCLACPWGNSRRWEDALGLAIKRNRQLLSQGRERRKALRCWWTVLQDKRRKSFLKVTFPTLRLYFSSNSKYSSSQQGQKGRQKTREAPTASRAKIYLLYFGGQDFPRVPFPPGESRTDRGPRKEGRFHRETSLGKLHHLVASFSKA